MKESFREDLRYTVNRILEEEDFSDTEQLGRSLACFAVALESLTVRNGGMRFKGAMVSFGYVAAAVCLWELERWPPYSGTVYMPSFRIAR